MIKKSFLSLFILSALCFSQHFAIDIQFHGGSKYVFWNSEQEDDKFGDISIPMASDYQAAGVKVDDSAKYNTEYVLISDNANGFYIVWSESQNPNQYLYAMHFDSTGTPLWSDPIQINNVPTEKSGLTAVVNGAGDLIVAWNDDIISIDGIYVEILNTSLELVFGGLGLAISNEGTSKTNPILVSGDNTDAYVVWGEERGGFDGVYIQRIKNTGLVMFEANGLAITNYTSDASGISVCKDGLGGIMAVWLDNRAGYLDIYGQQIDGNGNYYWGSNGSIIVSIAEPGLGLPLKILSNESLGAFILYSDEHIGYSKDIFCQKIDQYGLPQWAAQGKLFVDNDEIELYNFQCCFEDMELLIVWNALEEFDTEVIVNKFSSEGLPQWGLSGVSITNDTYDNLSPIIVSDGLSGAIIAWLDNRSSVLFDIYLQHLDGNGFPKMAPGGARYLNEHDPQSQLSLVPLSNGEAVIAWMDGRNTTSSEVYYGKVEDPATAINSGDLEITRADSDQFSWTISDDNNGIYRISVKDPFSNNYIFRDWSPFLSNVPILISPNKTWPGVWNYTIDYYDGETGIWGTQNRVSVTLLDEIPVISGLTDLETTLDDYFTFNFSIHDDFADSSHPARYFRVLKVDLNGINRTHVDWAAWSSDVIYKIPIDRSAIGTYTYYIEVNSSTGEHLTQVISIEIVVPTDAGALDTNVPPKDLLELLLIIGIGVVLLLLIINQLRLTKKMNSLQKNLARSKSQQEKDEQLSENDKK